VQRNEKGNGKFHPDDVIEFNVCLVMLLNIVTQMTLASIQKYENFAVLICTHSHIQHNSIVFS
jgi:hypothetical protein